MAHFFTLSSAATRLAIDLKYFNKINLKINLKERKNPNYHFKFAWPGYTRIHIHFSYFFFDLCKIIYKTIITAKAQTERITHMKYVLYI